MTYRIPQYQSTILILHTLKLITLQIKSYLIIKHIRSIDIKCKRSLIRYQFKIQLFLGRH